MPETSIRLAAGQRVLRDQAGLDPTIEALVSGYDESTTTRDVVHPDGVRSRTVVVTSSSFAERLRCLGWLDVTDQWRRKQRGRAPAQTTLPPSEVPVTPDTAPDATVG